MSKKIIIVILLCILYILAIWVNADVPFNFIILNFSKIFLFTFVIMTTFFLYRLVAKKFIQNNMFYLIWSLFFLLSIPYIPVLLGYETTQIGDFYEAKEYTEKYYVIMSKEPETAKKRTVYKLPAEIERRYDYEGTTEIYEDYYFQEHGGNDIYILNYHINRLYLSNGDYLIFNYDDSFDFPELTRLFPGKEAECIDANEEIYYITLTTEQFK